MSELQTMIFETADRIFADHVTHDLIARVESAEVPNALWRDLSEAGLPKALCKEESGGIGGTWEDVYGVVKALGARAVPLPLGDIMAAHWLAELAGIDLPADAIPALAKAEMKGGKHILSASLESALPDHLLGWHEESNDLVLAKRPEPSGPRTISGASMISCEVSSNEVLASAKLETALSADLLCAMLRSAQMVGAMEAALRLTVDYANERVQFGRPIGKFQAIQQQLAELSGHVAAAARAAEVAFETTTPFDIACAKLIAGEAAEVATNVTHQVHGAIGFTYEYQLQFLTRRLWAWGSEFGSAAHWAEKIGVAALAEGADGLWPAITGSDLAL